MAAQLWLLRHGEAVPHESKPDHDRELTARGERQSDAAGAALARVGVEFDACYASPKVRARDTAARACGALNIEPQVAEVLADGFDADDARELLMGHDGDARILLVGHEPTFSQVVHDLTGARIDFKKGGIAAVRMSSAPELIVLLRPREVETLARGG